MVAEGYKKTEIGVIPVEWEVKSLSEIGSFSKGKGVSKNEVIKYGIPCMRYAEIYTKYDTVLKNIKSFINKKSALNSKQIYNGDILFAGSGETLKDIGKSVAFLDDFEAYVGGDTVILSPDIDYIALFMAYQLNASSVRTQLRKLGQGNSVVHIYSSGLEQVIVPLPPLKEQEKIADILSTADDKIDAIASQIEKAQTLKKGLLQKLLSEGIGHSEFKDSELGKMPESWEVVQVGKHTKLMGGYAFKSKDAKEFGTRWLKIANVGINQIKWEQVSYLEDTYQEEYKKFLLQENDIVLAMTRPILSMKLKIAKITNSDIPALLNQRVGKFIFDDDVNDEFMYQLFQHIDFVKLLMLKIMGTDPPNVSSEQLESIQIPLPPLKEQKQIAEILSTADEKLEVLRAKKEKYETLKKGLLQKLLSGEVRV